MMWEAEIRPQKLSLKTRKDLKEIFPEIDSALLRKPKKAGYLRITHIGLAGDFLNWIGHEIKLSSFHSITESESEDMIFLVGSWKEHGDIFMLQMHDDFIQISTEDMSLFNEWITKIKEIANKSNIMGSTKMIN